MISWQFHNQLLRRLLFALANLTLCAVIGIAVVKPTLAFFSGRENLIVEQQRILARLTAIAAQEGHVKSIESSTESQMKGSEFLVGPNENVINADLQTRLKAITASAGARSRAVQSLPPKTNDQIKYTGARIELYGPLRSIFRAVFAIERANPYLFIIGAVIRTTPSEVRPGEPTEPLIQAQLDIFSAIQIKAHSP